MATNLTNALKAALDAEKRATELKVGWTRDCLVRAAQFLRELVNEVAKLREAAAPFVELARRERFGRVGPPHNPDTAVRLCPQCENRQPPTLADCRRLWEAVE